MRKILKFGTLFLATMLSVTCIGCGEAKTYKELAYYDNAEYVDGVARYDDELFRRNDFSKTIADPSVLYVDDENREDFGTFYLYGTMNSCNAATVQTYKSKDMTNWEAVQGCIISQNVIDSNVMDANVYAPHVIEDNGKYYMFISGKPLDGPTELLYLLASDNPYGPFDFAVNDNSRTKSYLNQDGNAISVDDYWSQYMFFNPVEYAKRVMDLETVIGRSDLYETYQHDGYFSNIDPYAFIDDDGTRYVYFVFRSTKTNRYLAGVRCGDSFADVDYSSLSLLTLGGYMDVQGTTRCDYQLNSEIDEGPNMIKHNGKYYLTYSFGSLGTTYQVGQAVSDNPLSGFRKLELSENGKLLSDDNMRFTFTNPGGHDIVEVDGKMYIVYHRNISLNPESSPYSRVVGTDELHWVTIKDKFGNDLDVMYANGPTVNIQPKFDFISNYHNIASQARVKVTNLQKGSSKSALIDGLLSMYTVDNETFNEKYIKETIVTAKTTITMTFSDYVSVCGLMIYDSKYLTRAFTGIERIELDCIDENGVKVTQFISDLSVDWRTNRHSYIKRSLKNAAAAIASFDELKCKEIRITIDVPQSGWSTDEDGNLTLDGEGKRSFVHEKIVGISEIVVLGR